MLRGGREVDQILTMELWGTGTMTVDGKPCKTNNYHAMVRYPMLPNSAVAGNAPPPSPESKLIGVPAMRTAFTCAGTPRVQIQVVAGTYGWNEEKPGINATPAMNTVNDRLLQLWTLIPQSVVKAAMAAGANTKLSEEGGMTILTFPMPEPFQVRQ